MKRNWIRTIIGGLSFTSALFIFQACYGTPQDFEPDLLLEGQVKSQNTGTPIKGIKVSVPDVSQYEFTDENGRFSFYTWMNGNINLHFEDVDSLENGLYLPKDTLLTNVSDKVSLEINLVEK